MMADPQKRKLFFNSEVPFDWEIQHFEEIALIDKKSLKSNTPNNYGFDYISLSDVDSEDFKIERSRQLFETAPSRARKIVTKGDILMSTVRPNLRGFSLVKEDAQDLIASTGFAVITATKCVNEYLFQFLFCEGIDRQFHRLLVGSNYPAINSSDVKKLKIPLPPLAEQRAIAHVLGLVDKAIELNNKVIAQKELRKKWLMQNLLPGKRRLIGFTGKWKEVGIGELLVNVFRYVEWNDEDTYKLVSIRRRYRGLFERGDFLGHQIEVKKIKIIQKNDFLISKRQVSHGAWSIVSSGFQGRMVSDEYDCLALKDAKKLDMEFWGWFCQNPIMTHYAFLASNGVHIEKLIFDFKSFKKRKVLIPESLEEQTAIAQVLQAAEKEIELQKAKTEKLREQKKGMMQQLLTGKKRLKVEE